MKQISPPLKATIIGATVGITLIGILAAYFRRRRNKKPWKDLQEECDGNVVSNHRVMDKPKQVLQNGGIPYLPGIEVIKTEPRDISHENSALSFRADDSASVASTITALTQDSSTMNPHQLWNLGIDNMTSAISFWEDALFKIQQQCNIDGEPGVNCTTAQDACLQTILEKLIHHSQALQSLTDSYKYQMQNNIALDTAVAALQEMDRRYEKERHRWRSLSYSEQSSDDESFVSAVEVPDLSDLEEQHQAFQHLAFYEAGVLELKHGSVPCRTLRTTMVQCLSDSEFLAKLHCLRITLNEMFLDETIRAWFCDTGKQVIGGLLMNAEKDPEDFYCAFDDMIKYVYNLDNWEQIEDELKGRGVKAMTFYDIVLDFILMDAFDDLANPPASVTAVVQNRWLSNGFKETALSTAAWSVLKAKRRMLRHPEGFIAHFYSVSEHVSPVLAWGFLGPDGDLKNVCMFFKDQILQFLADIFSFDKVRFTVVEQLADDIMRIARNRAEILSAKLSLPST